MKNLKRAIRLEVFRSALGDCTNGGVSAKSDTIYLVCEGGYLDVAELPADLLFYAENRGGSYWAARPVHEKGWSMFGGNLAQSSDSRCPAPLHIHDRYETAEQTRILSQ